MPECVKIDSYAGNAFLLGVKKLFFLAWRIIGSDIENFFQFIGAIIFKRFLIKINTSKKVLV